MGIRQTTFQQFVHPLYSCCCGTGVQRVLLTSRGEGPSQAVVAEGAWIKAVKDVLQPVLVFERVFLHLSALLFLEKHDPNSLQDRDEHSWSHLGVCSLKQLNSSPLRRKFTLLLKMLLTCWRASFGEKPGSFCNENSSSCGTSGLSGVLLLTQSHANTCTILWAVLTLLWHEH